MGLYRGKDRRGKPRYYVEKRWPEGSGRFKRVVPNRTIGKKLLARIEESIAMGTWRQLREELSRGAQKVVTLQDLSREYLEHCRTVNRRPEFKEKAIKPVLAILGSIPLKGLTRAHANRFIRQRSQQVAPPTVNRGLAILKHMLTYALNQGLLDHHPLHRFPLLPEPQKALVVMSLEQERRLVDCVARRDLGVGALTAFLGETGLRKSEGLRLEWSHIDLGNRIVSVGNTKSGRVRHVPLTQYALQWLSRLVRVIGQPRVFLRSDGKPRKNPRKPFKAGARDAGLDWVRGFHDLRHFRATQWIKHGIDVRTVKELLGHASIEMTMRYAHFAPDHATRMVHQVEAAERLQLQSQQHHPGAPLIPQAQDPSGSRHGNSTTAAPEQQHIPMEGTDAPDSHPPAQLGRR